jgi:hypothetical protein
MRKIAYLLLTVLLSGPIFGCGGLSEKEKGKNSGLDRPKPAGEKPAGEKPAGEKPAGEKPTGEK